MEFLEIPFGSALYEQSLDLRQRVLRTPLGLLLSEQDLAGEITQRHFGLLNEERRLLACVVIKPVNYTTGRLRQMAVTPEMQSGGLGRRLIEEVEAVLMLEHTERIELHARCLVQKFYERLGYQVHGESFSEIGIPHIEMFKMLSVTNKSKQPT